MLRAQRAGLEQGERVAALGQSTHHHAVLAVARQRLADLAHPTAALPVLERRHAEVDVGGQPAVESDLAQAVRVALGPAREAHEAQVHRLAELVVAPAAQEHVGEVGLHVLDAGGRVGVARVGGRPTQRGQLVRPEARPVLSARHRERLPARRAPTPRLARRVHCNRAKGGVKCP